MIGLIKKDLLMTKGNWKTILVIFVVFTLMAINGNGEFSFIPVFISLMLMMSTFSYDEYNKSDAYISTLPCGRKIAVQAKYLATLLVMLISVLITGIVSCFVGIMTKNFDIEYIVSTTIGCVSAIIFVQAIIYPVIYKFGVEKSRIAMFVFVFSVTGIGSLLFQSGFLTISSNVVQFFNQFWMVIIPLFLLFSLGISYKLSERFYTQKEF